MSPFVFMTQSIIGESELWDCADYSVTPDIAGITSSHRSPRSPGGGKVAITMTTFLSTLIPAPKKPWHGPKSYPNMDGKTIISSKCLTCKTQNHTQSAANKKLSYNCNLMRQRMTSFIITEGDKDPKHKLETCHI